MPAREWPPWTGQEAQRMSNQDMPVVHQWAGGRRLGGLDLGFELGRQGDRVGMPGREAGLREGQSFDTPSASRMAVLSARSTGSGSGSGKRWAGAYRSAGSGKWIGGIGGSS